MIICIHSIYIYRRLIKMKKNIFMLVLLSAMLLFAYGCGSHKIESESSSPIVESVTNTALHTHIPDVQTSTVKTESAAQTTKQIVTASVKPAISTNKSETTVTTITDASKAVITTTTFKSPSGETDFKPITNQHAQYPPRVPTVVRPHEPVIYTTAPPTETSSETVTTVISDITDIVTSDIDITEPSEENTTEPSTEAVIPDPVTPDELYFYGMTPGDDIIDLIGSFGEYNSMTYTPGEYRDDGVQAENRHYYFTDMELITFWYGDEEILGEIIVTDSTFKTSREITIGMTADDIINAYGNCDTDGTIYKYQAETGYIYFHIDENNLIDYIGFHGIY